MTTRRAVGAVGPLVVSLVCIASCGSSAPSELAASSAWSRPTPATATSGVVYLVLETDVDDTLVSASVPADVAVEAQLHATTIDDGSGHSHHGGDDTGATATMEHLDEVAVDADEPLVFEPGGDHIMLIDLADPLVLGEEFTLTLEFSSGRSLAVDVIVADNPPE